MQNLSIFIIASYSMYEDTVCVPTWLTCAFHILLVMEMLELDYGFALEMAHHAKHSTRSSIYNYTYLLPEVDSREG